MTDILAAAAFTLFILLCAAFALSGGSECSQMTGTAYLGLGPAPPAECLPQQAEAP